MIDPTMNATPPTKYRRCQTSAAARTLSAKPVSEIALGVSRDSISRSRTISRRLPLVSGARPLRRALQKYIEDPLSEALIQGTITTRPAFIEVFLESNKLYYRPVDAEKTEGVLLYES